MTRNDEGSNGHNNDGPLDPVPKTSAGQARHFYYETDEANLTVNSKDYDDLYNHGQTRHLADLVKSNAKDHDGELVDKDELTFGSRPPTAPEQDKKRRDQESTYTPSAKNIADNSMIENSMVNMGQITIDRKNDLLGNRFQDPSRNQHESEDTIKNTNSTEANKLGAPDIIKSESLDRDAQQ